jgi:hypothetical protein
VRSRFESSLAIAVRYIRNHIISHFSRTIFVSLDDTVSIPIDYNYLPLYTFEDLKRDAILVSLGEPYSSTRQIDVDLYFVFFIYSYGPNSVTIANDSHLKSAIQRSTSLGSVEVFATVFPTFQPNVESAGTAAGTAAGKLTAKTTAKLGKSAAKATAKLSKSAAKLAKSAAKAAAKSSTQTVHSPTSIATLATHEMITYIVKLALVGSGGKKGEQFRNILKV